MSNFNEDQENLFNIDGIIKDLKDFSKNRNKDNINTEDSKRENIFKQSNYNEEVIDKEECDSDNTCKDSVNKNTNDKEVIEIFNKGKIEKLENENKRLINALLSSEADYKNYRNRTNKEIQESKEVGKIKIALDLFDIMDNFKRGLLSTPLENRDNSFYDGMILINNQFEEMLLKYGFEEINALNMPFDPDFHNALTVKKVEGINPNIVIEVYSTGYIKDGKVIKPSDVIVSC